MDTLVIVSRKRHYPGIPEVVVPVYQIAISPDDAISMFWYGENERLIPFLPPATLDTVRVCLARAMAAPDAVIRAHGPASHILSDVIPDSEILGDLS